MKYCNILLSFLFSANIESFKHNFCVLQTSTTCQSNFLKFESRLTNSLTTFFYADRTTIIIAHRLSTIRYAKKIFVLHDGKVVEEGSHNELMLKNKYYANLTRIQLGVHGSDETIHIDTPENNRFNGNNIPIHIIVIPITLLIKKCSLLLY